MAVKGGEYNMASFKMKGFDKLEKQLKQAEKAARELSKTTGFIHEKIHICFLYG